MLAHHWCLQHGCVFTPAIALSPSCLPPPRVFSAAERLPRWAEVRHHHAPEQRNSGAVVVCLRKSGLLTLAVTAHQDLLLRPWGVSPPSGWCSPSHLLCLLGIHGGAERQHCAGHPGYDQERSRCRSNGRVVWKTLIDSIILYFTKTKDTVANLILNLCSLWRKTGL